MLVVVGACGTADGAQQAPPPPTQSATTSAPVATAPAAPTTSAAPSTTADTAFPVTVTGTNGTSLTVERRPERIISLSATHTEMLYAIGAGDQVIGTDLTSNYPPQAEATPKLDAFNFNVEEVVALDPDLVILAFDFQGEVNALELLDIPTLLLGLASTLEEMMEQINTVGAATGHQAEAAELVSGLEAQLKGILADLPQLEEPLTVFHEVDATLFSPNSASFLGDIYQRLGLVNIADAVPDEFGSGYVQLSEEFIIAADPDLVLLGDASFGESIETVGTRPGWDTLTAVQNGWVFELDGDVAGRWGPRTIGLVAQIAKAIREVVGA
jgi:iron complex transport system substrate-binding protein